MLINKMCQLITNDCYGGGGGGRAIADIFLVQTIFVKEEIANVCRKTKIEVRLGSLRNQTTVVSVEVCGVNMSVVV